MERNTERTMAQLIAWGRVGIGTVAVIAPVAVARPWIGGAARTTEGRLLARAMGGRDLALGIGTLRALAHHDDEARPWVALGGVADSIDAVATLVGFAALPTKGRWGILAVTVGAAAVSIRLAASLDDPGTSPTPTGVPTQGTEPPAG
jgi:hypothetical protein